MLRPRVSRARSRAPLTLSGPTLLALHAGHDNELTRLASARPWQVDPSCDKSMMDRLRGLGASLTGDDAAPALPESLAGMDALYDFEAGYFIAGDVAIITIEGVLAPKGYYDYWDDCWVPGYSDIAEAVIHLQDDDRVVGALASIYSPGGVAYGCDELAATIRQHSARNGGKPIAAHCQMAFSAAQYIASACDATYAPRAAGLGSIGVRMGWFDFSGMMAEDGVKREEFVSGKYKDSGSPFRPVTDEERAMFQADIDTHARFFFEAVAEGRDLDANAVRDWGARTFTAGAGGALDPEAAGLLDAVLTEREAFDAVRELAGQALITRSTSTSTPEPAATARAASVRPARRMSSTSGGNKEETMSLKSTIAALRAKAANGDTAAAAELAEYGITATAGGVTPNSESDAPDPDGEGGDDPDPDAEGDDPDADDGADPDADEDDDDVEPSALGDAGRKIAAIAGRDGKAALGASLAVDVTAGDVKFGAALRALNSAGRDASAFRTLAANNTPKGLSPSKGRKSANAADDTLAASMKAANRR